jgi:hypothetical protein
MFVIHKFVIEVGELAQEIKLSGKLHSFLKVDVQNGVPMVWVATGFYSDEVERKENICFMHC